MRTKRLLCKILCVFFLAGACLTEGIIPVNAEEPEMMLFESVNFDRDITDGTLYTENNAGQVVYDSTVYHGSGRSLKYERTDPKSYILIDRSFPARPGQKFSAACWVKSEGINNTEGNGNDALICIQAYNEKGDWIEGQYLSAGVTATSDWTMLSVPVYKMPANTAKASVTIYIRKNATGTAWFDDLLIYKEKVNLLDTCLISPPYRGLTADNSKGDIKVSAGLLNVPGFDTSDIKLVFEMIDSANKITASSEIKEVKGNAAGVFNSSDLKAGKYTLRVKAVDNKTLIILDTNDWAITKAADKSKMPSSYVDRYGRFMKDGKPFFPIGCFFETITKAEADVFANSSFNVVIPNNTAGLTPAFMDYLNSKGLKVLYSLKDYYYGSDNCPPAVKSIKDEVPAIIKTVDIFKKHPALLGWYMGNEVSAVVDGDRLASHYNAIAKADYNHPTYTNDYRLNEISLFNRLSDTFGVSIYPISGSSGDNIAIAGMTARGAKKDFPNRPLWMCLQVHNPNNYGDNDGVKRYAPNLNEVRNMAWQYICEGATGLMFNSWYDMKNDESKTPFNTLWGYSKEVAKQVKDYAPMILSIEAVPAVTISGGGDWLNWTVRNYNKKTYIFSVNNTKTAARTVSFTIPGAKKCKELTSGKSLTVTNGKFTTPDYGALGVKLYEITY